MNARNTMQLRKALLIAAAFMVSISAIAGYAFATHDLESALLSVFQSEVLLESGPIGD